MNVHNRKINHLMISLILSIGRYVIQIRGINVLASLFLEEKAQKVTSEIKNKSICQLLPLHFCQINLKLQAGVKKCHFSNFSERAENRDGPKEYLARFQKFFLLWVRQKSQQCQKAKLERVLSFRVQSGKKMM